MFVLCCTACTNPHRLRTRFDYRCADGMRFTAIIQTNAAKLLLPSSSVTLPQTIAASGVRYTNGAITFWTKGNKAQFEQNGHSHPGCWTPQFPGGPPAESP